MTEHPHDNQHGDQHDEPEQDPVDFWQTRYGERDQIWSGNPNAALVSCVAGLEPGRALDLGCGEGGDSIWLASLGWQVTGVDISDTAVSRAREHVEQAGLSAGSFTGVVADLSEWEPQGQFELVSAFFLHSPVGFPRTEVLQRAASAVAVGGHLLIVGHGEPPPWSEHKNHQRHELLGPEAELAQLNLDESKWTTVVLETREREATGPDGGSATLEDAITFIQRRSDA